MRYHNLPLILENKMFELWAKIRYGVQTTIHIEINAIYDFKKKIKTWSNERMTAKVEGGGCMINLIIIN